MSPPRPMLASGGRCGPRHDGAHATPHRRHSSGEVRHEFRTTPACSGTSVTVVGIVTGSYEGSGKLSSFFVQEEDADADAHPLTSEGLFVYCAACQTAANEGHRVHVAGLVSEFFSLTEITASTAGAVAITLPQKTADASARLRALKQSEESPVPMAQARLAVNVSIALQIDTARSAGAIRRWHYAAASITRLSPRLPR
jgi:predicted extracellular nuclease